MRRVARFVVLAALLATVPRDAGAREWVVAVGGTGTGAASAPFGSIQAAIAAAAPGDTVIVRPGVYEESLRTVRAGTRAAPITIRSAAGDGQVVVMARTGVLSIDDAFTVVQGLVLDGDYAPHAAVDIASTAYSTVLRDVEVRRSGRDCVNIGSAQNVLIEGALIHHCLNPADGGTDAHGIVASAVTGLTIRRTDIHTFSGDALQLNRQHTSLSPGWNDVLLEDCRFWLEPLAREENGFPQGAVPGENAIDTKVSDDAPRARLTMRGIEVWGFRHGRIANQAAFNLKEHIDATLDRVTVRDSSIAFRTRGAGADPDGAWVTVLNSVVYDVDVAFRYEDDIARLRIWNVTVGLDVDRPFRAADSRADGLDVRNLLVVGGRLPDEARSPANLAVEAAAVVDAAAGDYRLVPGSPAVDAGSIIPEVIVDRAGTARPDGGAYDVGAYEWCASRCAPAPAPASASTGP